MLPMHKRSQMSRLEKITTYAHFSSLPDDRFREISAAVVQRRRQMGLTGFNLITGELEQSR